MKKGDTMTGNTRTGKGNELSSLGLILGKRGLLNSQPASALQIDKIVFKL